MKQHITSANFNKETNEFSLIALTAKVSCTFIVLSILIFHVAHDQLLPVTKKLFEQNTN